MSPPLHIYILYARMYSEKIARRNFILAGLFGFVRIVCARRRRDPILTESRGGNRVSRLSRWKSEGSDPVWFGWSLKPTIARARSFHSFLSFVRSFTEKIHEPESASAGLRGVLGRCVNVRIMRHQYPRPAKCAIFSIQDSRPTSFNPPCLFFHREKKRKNTLCDFLSIGLSMEIRFSASVCDIRIRNCTDFDFVVRYNRDPWE